MPASWAEARGQLEQEADVKLFLDTPEQDVWVDQSSVFFYFLNQFVRAGDLLTRP
jgi:hypothetical protein